jgi:hypothetical protein
VIVVDELYSLKFRQVFPVNLDVNIALDCPEELVVSLP